MCNGPKIFSLLNTDPTTISSPKYPPTSFKNQKSTTSAEQIFNAAQSLH